MCSSDLVFCPLVLGFCVLSLHDLETFNAPARYVADFAVAPGGAPHSQREPRADLAVLGGYLQRAGDVRGFGRAIAARAEDAEYV